MSTILECQHLKKYFDTPKGCLYAVDDISFSLERGHTLGVVGESGCGKTTLGRTILCLTPPTSGKVFFEGEDIFNCSKQRMKELRQKMQMIFQDPFSSLSPKMTVYQSIADPLMIHRRYRTKAECEDRVSQLMEMVGLADRYVNTFPHELDGGRRQRIGIARALALDPTFIICDEPVSALDVSIQAQILNLMMDLKDNLGLTYMFITHDLSVVKHLSDEIMVLYMGHTAEYAKPDELFNNPLHPYTSALLSAIPLADISFRGKELQVIKGEVSSPVDSAPGCRFAPRCPRSFGRCREATPELKDAGAGHLVACFLYEKDT